MTKEEIERILKEADESLGNYTDRQLNGFAKLSKNIKGENNPIHKMKKNPFTDEEFIKINTERNRNRIISAETKKKLSNSHKGKKLSEEHKKSISDAQKGIPKTPEQIRKIAEANTGKKRSIETKRKFSELKKGVPNPTTSKTNKRLNSQIYLCEHCNREIGGRANYVRFHGDNCKKKP